MKSTAWFDIFFSVWMISCVGSLFLIDLLQEKIVSYFDRKYQLKLERFREDAKLIRKGIR